MVAQRGGWKTVHNKKNINKKGKAERNWQQERKSAEKKGSTCCQNGQGRHAHMETAAKELVLKKDEVEREIQELTAYLTAPGMPGLSGGLVDREGYPLADVDKIIAVRQARHRLACTSTLRPRCCFSTPPPLWCSSMKAWPLTSKKLCVWSMCILFCRPAKRPQGPHGPDRARAAHLARCRQNPCSTPLVDSSGGSSVFCPCGGVRRFRREHRWMAPEEAHRAYRPGVGLFSRPHCRAAPW